MWENGGYLSGPLHHPNQMARNGKGVLGSLRFVYQKQTQT